METPVSVEKLLKNRYPAVGVCQSQRFTADSQSVSMSWCRAHFVDVLPDIASFQEFGSGICCPVSVGRPLWRETGSVICKPGNLSRFHDRFKRFCCKTANVTSSINTNEIKSLLKQTVLKTLKWYLNSLYRPSDLHLWAKLVPTFGDRGVSRGQRGGSLTAVFSAFYTGAATFCFK
jgi:hypothetical protein